MSAIQSLKLNIQYLCSRIGGTNSHSGANSAAPQANIDAFTSEPIRRFNPTFDFIHWCLERLQDGLEILTAAALQLVKSWRFKFFFGVISGLLLLYLIICLF